MYVNTGSVHFVNTMMEHKCLRHRVTACIQSSFYFIRSRKQFWKHWFVISWQTLSHYHNQLSMFIQVKPLPNGTSAWDDKWRRGRRKTEMCSTPNPFMLSTTFEQRHLEQTSLSLLPTKNNMMKEKFKAQISSQNSCSFLQKKLLVPASSARYTTLTIQPYTVILGWQRIFSQVIFQIKA